MKYQRKNRNIDAIRWNGKNTEQVTTFLAEHGLKDTFLERRVDTPIWVNTKHSRFAIYQGEYVGFYEDRSVATFKEVDFISAFELAE